MSANTGLARQIERARGLFGEVVRLAEGGKRDEQDVGGLLLVLQAIKDGERPEVSKTRRRFTLEQLARRGMVKGRFVDRDMIVITIPVDYDQRVVSVRAQFGTMGGNISYGARTDSVAQRTGVQIVEIYVRRFKRMNRREIAQAFDRDGLEPAVIEELRDLGVAADNDPKLPVPVYGFGTIWNTPFLGASELRGCAGGRYLSADSIIEGERDWWCAARRKRKAA